MGIGVGMPANILLNQFASIVHDAFGQWPYLVGSALVGKQWRDVDVRLILEDDEYERVIGKLENPPILNHRWAAFSLAFSILGKQMTGLPIDFQIDQQTEVNARTVGKPRSALILYSEFHIMRDNTTDVVKEVQSSEGDKV